jgi:cytochrome oxidase Cu insertion factor (SCO1/SenC/PrrC family)
MRVALASLLLLLVAGPTWPVAAADKPLDTLLSDLQLAPLGGQVPPPFELEQFADGKKVALAQHRGRPVLLYFWATW